MIVITAFQKTCGSITHVHEQENKRRCVPTCRMGPRSLHKCIRSPPRPALCRETINRPLLSFEGNSVFITVSHDIWIQCCSELVVGADGKIPRSVTIHARGPSGQVPGSWDTVHRFREIFCVPQLTVSNDGVSSFSVCFIFHLIVQVLETMILSRGRATVTTRSSER